MWGATNTKSTLLYHDENILGYSPMRARVRKGKKARSRASALTQVCNLRGIHQLRASGGATPKWGSVACKWILSLFSRPLTRFSLYAHQKAVVRSSATMRQNVILHLMWAKSVFKKKIMVGLVDVPSTEWVLIQFSVGCPICKPHSSMWSFYIICGQKIRCAPQTYLSMTSILCCWCSLSLTDCQQRKRAGACSLR